MTLRVPPAPGRHRAAAIAEAKSLREAGWSTRKVAKFVGVGQTTVLRWTDEKQDRKISDGRRRRDRLRLVRESQGRMTRTNATPEFREARIRSLRAAGLSSNAVAKVMSFDFPEHAVTVHQVRYLLGEKGAA